MAVLQSLENAPTPLQDSDLLFVVTSGTPAHRKAAASAFKRYALGATVTAQIGFYGAAYVDRPAGAGQAAAAGTMADPAALTVGAAVATTAATSASPFGFTTAAQANDLVARVNELRADVSALRASMVQAKADIGVAMTLANAIRSALVSIGLIKGSA